MAKKKQRTHGTMDELVDMVELTDADGNPISLNPKDIEPDPDWIDHIENPDADVIITDLGEATGEELK